jgi:hypothetical protein
MVIRRFLLGILRAFMLNRPVLVVLAIICRESSSGSSS